MAGLCQSDVNISNGICLGNIYLDRTALNTEDCAFIKGAQSIGGLIGKFVGSIYQLDSENNCFVVLTTIRDYALAQKIDLEVGPVVGTNSNRVFTKGEGIILSIYFS